MNTFFLELTPNKFNEIDERLLSFVSEERKASVLRYKFDKDKRLSLYATLLTKMQISKLLKCHPNAINFTIADTKKPYLLNNPNIYFSYSHSENGILLAISESCEIGADVQMCDKGAFSIMQNAFHSDEISYVNSSISLEEKAHRFYEIWTKKEAYTKYTGTGIACSLNQINTLSSPINDTLHTWEQGIYVCSAFTCISEENIKHVIYENEIVDFFFS